MLTLIKEWLIKTWKFIALIAFIAILIACFVSGCNYHKNHFRCPEITTNTVIIHDTIIHKIVDSFPYYIVKRDTVIYTDSIIQSVDTAAILQNYFAWHVYSRQWEDSLLKVNLRDTVTENRFLGNDFRYQILRPQTIINNILDQSVHYSKYVYAGIDFPFYNAEFSEIALLITFKRGYIGGGYAPLQKGGSLKAGVRLFTWE